MTAYKNILDTPIEFLKGVGPMRGELLKKELSIFTFRQLLMLFPFRYIDKTQFHQIRDLNEDSGDVQLKGVVRKMETIGEGAKKRFVARFRDETGAIDLIWFRGINWIEKNLQVGSEYVVFGRVNTFRDQMSIPHPEIELVTPDNSEKAQQFEPVYPSTEKLSQRGLDMKVRRKIVADLLSRLSSNDLTENLPEYIYKKLHFASHESVIRTIHFPKNQEELVLTRNRLKFEELFFLQLRILKSKKFRQATTKGFIFEHIGEYFTTFYNEKLPFQLTNAQKKVIKEIRHDLGIGKQMNRLVQGDVGSGKTIVGFMAMLIAIGNGFQASMMAPTEILAGQHFVGLSAFAEGIGLKCELLTGSIKGKKRKQILADLANGDIHILVGTHALIEDSVVFKNLGLAITDEQHRFGVEQRAALWRKNPIYPPHVLVMTATPIPRTLAMTLYGDLDVSVIDELPPGRKEIKTVHRTEHHRLRVLGFIREEIAKGRQIYIVYPLIEESETLEDLQNLMNGFESISQEFPQPEFQVSIVHGRMKAAEKEFEMQRFVKHETQIMVATTVIEVGVNVPNASVMIIENTERFGLSQLHQLRGRVGRGAEQSYCILMSSFKLSTDARERIDTMCRTTDGFEIAEADLRLRGPGNIEGTQQSGILNLSIADLAKDGKILQTAREIANRILDDDANFARPEHLCLKNYMDMQNDNMKIWGKIS